MGGDEKTPGMSKSAPPRAPLTDIELLIRLDRLSRSVDSIIERLTKAETNDERFKQVEHDVRVAKWAVMIFGGALITAMAVATAARFSIRISDPPPSASNAERLGSDRIAVPRPPTAP